MGEQRNLTKENVNKLTKELEEMKKDNPDLEYCFFNQDEVKDDLANKILRVEEKADTILAKVENLTRWIEHVIDSHTLINGKWVKL